MTNPLTNPSANPVTNPVTNPTVSPLSPLVNVRVTPTCRSFVLKVKTPQIRVCQSCRQSYEGENDTLNLVVARLERQVISNLSAIYWEGKQFALSSSYALPKSC